MVSREKTNPLEKKALPTLRQVNQYIVKVLLRPIFMFGEPIVLFTDLYILLLYSLFFLYFEAYPIIFKGKCLHKRLKGFASLAGNTKGV